MRIKLLIVARHDLAQVVVDTLGELQLFAATAVVAVPTSLTTRTGRHDVDDDEDHDADRHDNENDDAY